jgi:hypothetical protein
LNGAIPSTEVGLPGQEPDITGDVDAGRVTALQQSVELTTSAMNSNNSDAFMVFAFVKCGSRDKNSFPELWKQANYQCLFLHNMVTFCVKQR